MADFTMSIDADLIAVIRFDAVGRTMNTLTAAAWDELATLFEQVSGDVIEGAIIISGKDNGFCAGADLDELIRYAGSAPTADEDRRDHHEFAFRANRVARMIETCGKPVVAAINGLALGGGFELALACHHRVVSDNPKLRLGLPEATIGLLPGGGGTQRVARLLGVARAMPLLLEGKTLTAQEARELGLVDEVVAAGEELAAARRWIKAGGVPVAPWDRENFALPGGLPAGNAESIAAAAGISESALNNYPAYANIARAVYEGVAVSMDEALQIETACFLATLQSPPALAMIRTLFRSHPALRKGPSPSSASSVVAARKVAVLGAGMMGAGIAYSLAKVGVETVLVDVSQEAADRGKAYSETLLDRLVAKGLYTRDAADTLLSNIVPTADYGQVAGADVLIETVFEDVAIKAEATSRALAHLPADILVASNTSTLPISTLAEVHSTPENFVGMHFHSPVDRMELVELVRGKRTARAALDHALAIVRQIGKTAIVANDSPFFYTSRVFDTYIREGMEMLVDGFPAEMIDEVGKMTGMPRGPLELTDDVAIDLIGRIADQRGQLLGEAAPRRRSDDVVDLLLGQGRLGRKNGMGFYDYPATGPKSVWKELERTWPVKTPHGNPDLVAELRRRFLHRQAVEAARCLAEGVLEDPRHADVGALLGWNFPRWTGGPVSYIEQIGLDRFVAECDDLAQKWGDRFAPPEMLRIMATTGQRFYDGLLPRPVAA